MTSHEELEAVKLDDEELTPKLIRTFYEEHHQCAIKGKIQAPKVTGQLTFRIMTDKPAVKKFLEEFPHA